jgi:cytoskeletal protein CcmA (bactofilin family)
MLIVRRVHHGEDGQAIVAGVAISFVMLVLITTLLAVAVHTNDVTVSDRSRAQGVQSAEAGVSIVLDGLTRAICVPDVGMSSPVSLTVQGNVVGQYQAMVRAPSDAGWNPNAVSSAGCTTSPPASNDRVITAWGYGPKAASDRKVLRKLEVQVKVAPLTGFRFACFAGGSSPGGVLSVMNNMIVNGDCYARTLSATNNNLVENGTLMSPGSVTVRDNVTFHGNVWSGGALVVGNNSVITGYVTSSTSSVHLNQNAHVLGNATAATTITLDNNAVIDGSRCPSTSTAPGCPTNPPPTLTMPAMRCPAIDFPCWAGLYPGMVSKTAAQMSAYLSSNKTNLTGSFFVNDPATIDFTGGGTVTGPLTVVTSGKIDLSRDLVTPSPVTAPSACTPVPGPRTCYVTLVSTNGGSDAIHVGPPRFTANTATLSVLLYTTGSVLVEGGANPTSFLGSVYGGTLDVQSNGMTVSQSQDLIDYPPPFVDWTLSAAAQFTVEPVAWRELTPAPPS